MPVIPTVHLNGTDGDTLLNRVADASNAVYAAIAALCEAGPNSRDYYPQGSDVALAAQREHEARIKSLRAICADLVTIHDGIQDQIDERAAQRKRR